MVQKAAPFLCLCLAAIVLAPRLHAETPADEVRYDIFKYEDGRYRFDRMTGKLEKMIITPEGVMYVEQPVVVSKKSASGTVARKTAPDADLAPAVNHTDNTVSQIGEVKKPARIQLYDENDKKLSEDVTDEDRKASLPDIARYEKDLAVMQNLKLSDRINGAIVVRNKGDRRIQKLEMTLVVPVQDKAPAEYRFLYVDSGAPDAPLQPVAGNQSISWFQKVDLDSPAGNTKGNLDVKVTYIKFYEKADQK
jgi:hypothetical protein